MQIENQEAIGKSKIGNVEGGLTSDQKHDLRTQAEDLKVSDKNEESDNSEFGNETQRRVGCNSWKRYCPAETKEINYSSDSLKENEKVKVLKKKIGLVGLADSFKEERHVFKKTKLMTFNSSSTRLMNVAENIMSRLASTGGLDEEKSIIKRKRHNNYNYYEQDDFIDDQSDHCRIQQYVTKYEDFFAFEGSKEDFMISSKYHCRVNEINNFIATKKYKRNIKRLKPLEKSNNSRSPSKNPIGDIDEFKQGKKINCPEVPKKQLIQGEIVNFFKATPSSLVGNEKKSKNCTPMNESSQDSNLKEQSQENKKLKFNKHPTESPQLLVEKNSNEQNMQEEILRFQKE